MGEPMDQTHHRASLAIAAILLVLTAGALPARGPEQVPGEPRVYMPCSASDDHMVIGAEISGYHMRYDLAKDHGLFMILLPDGYDSLARAPVYFAIDTLSFEGGTLDNLYEEDILAILEDEPGTRALRQDLGPELTRAGRCLGAELAYPEDRRAFPRERFFICKSPASQKYAILLSLGARDQQEMELHYPSFLSWADIPQMVHDSKVVLQP